MTSSDVAVKRIMKISPFFRIFTWLIQFDIISVRLLASQKMDDVLDISRFKPPWCALNIWKRGDPERSWSYNWFQFLEVHGCFYLGWYLKNSSAWYLGLEGSKNKDYNDRRGWQVDAARASRLLREPEDKETISMQRSLAMRWDEMECKW